MTSYVNRGYEIADQFRARGVPVAMGGVHPSFMPREALQHCDAVVVGVNKFQQEEAEPPVMFRLDPGLEKQQIARLGDLRVSRDTRAVDARLCALENAASVAGMILTTEALVTDAPEKKSAAPMPGGGGPDMYD